MKAEELRIGNWVFNKAHERKQLNEIYTDCSIYDPIPLTEEWLLRFGFKCFDIDEIGTYKKGVFVLVPNAKTHFTCTYSGRMLRFITCVHQLQNLYFALTGQELTIL